jgi:zinc/manganese transport system substrate-binding protein
MRTTMPLRSNRPFYFACLAVGLLLLSSGCGVSSLPPQPDDGRMAVVATYSILGEWVQEVGGPRVEVVTLVGRGGDAHTYHPVPLDSVFLKRASIVFENGLGFEGWLDKLFESSGSAAHRVAVTRGIDAQRIVTLGETEELDPHVWQDPILAISMVQAIADALADADPAHADEYRVRADDYVGELRRLDAWIREQTVRVPESRRVLVTTHDTFGYFADRYGFEVISVMGSVSSEAADPSAAEVAAVVQEIRSRRVPAVFAENILSPRLTRQIAREAGVRLVGTLYTDALGAADSPGASYVSMMRFNVQTIVEAML